MKEKRKIILGITGSIAAYKCIELTKLLMKNEFDVEIVLSKSASDFVPVLTLKSLFPGKIHCYDHALGTSGEMLHLSLAKSASMVLIAPASANMISKVACGLADCLISTICVATRAPIAFAPAMNKFMWENALLQRNVATLIEYKAHMIGPAVGMQACGDVGAGRMLEPQEIVAHVKSILTPKILKGKKVVVTAGPTRERFDSVRFISNLSSGKMGYAIARVAMSMGAQVILISGPTVLPRVDGVEIINVESAEEMLEASLQRSKGADIFIGTAAVADYKPKNNFAKKLSKLELKDYMSFKENVDIIEYVKKKYPALYCVAFAAETHELEKNGRKKLEKKGVDMIGVNDVSDGNVFGGDENELLMLTRDEQAYHIQRTSKEKVACQLLEKISECMLSATLTRC